MIATLPAVLVFLALLFFAVQLLAGLYASSVVTAVAFDAARLVAGGDGGPGAEAAAEDHARALLGRTADTATFAWSYVDRDGRAGAETVQLRVEAASPVRLLPSAAVPSTTIERTVAVRREALR
jgi:hypothetical protein